MTYTELGILPALAAALEKKNMGSPLPAQEAAAPVLLAGQSCSIVSRTGSGKTLAYLLPLLTGIDPDLPQAQVVVLAPTHELAMQISRVATELVREAGLPIRVQALIGGVAVARQLDGLKKKPHLVVGSAGRMTHLMDLKKLKLGHVRWLVLDEADRLLIDESLHHVRTIAAALPAETKYAFVSATEGPAAVRVAKELAGSVTPVRTQQDINPAIRHLFLVCEERDKIDQVRKAIRGLQPARTLVFVHRGQTAERMADKLAFHGLPVADLHGAHDKFSRQTALETFRREQGAVLIASDIAARGLDVSGVDLVINADAPSQSRDYLHRAGRTGRAGAAGTVLTLLGEADKRLARRYEEELDITLEQVRLVRGSLEPATGEEPASHPRRSLVKRPGPPGPASSRDKKPGPGRSERKNAQSPGNADQKDRPHGRERDENGRPKSGKNDSVSSRPESHSRQDGSGRPKTDRKSPQNQSHDGAGGRPYARRERPKNKS